MNLSELFTNRQFRKKLFRSVLIIILTAIAVIYGLFHTERLFAVVNTLASVFYPFFLGICIAFVLNVILKMYEEHVFAFLNRKNSGLWIRCRRMVCVVLTYLTVFAVLAGVVFFVLPELYQSLEKFVSSIPGHLRSITMWITEQLNQLDIDTSQIDLLNMDWSSLISQASHIASDFVGNFYDFMVSLATSIASGMFTLVMSMIFSVYMLSKKEHLLQGARKILYAFLPAYRARRVIEISAITNRIFSGFVAGQLTESLILGCLCYVGMSIIRLPYALLISTVVCVCSLIPLLGAYISMFTGGFILLFTTPWGSFPWDTLWFIIFFLALQQFEGNVIYPRVVGTSIGLPGIWVLLAVIVCSGLMGIGGILIGIPATSVLYALFTQSVKRRLKARHIEETQLNEPVNVDEALERPTGSPIHNMKNKRQSKINPPLEKLKQKAQELKDDRKEKQNQNKK